MTTFLVAGGTGSGNGQVSFPVALPAGTAGITFYRQWAELQATPTNALGLVVSNGRGATIQ